MIRFTLSQNSGKKVNWDEKCVSNTIAKYILEFFKKFSFIQFELIAYFLSNMLG